VKHIFTIFALIVALAFTATPAFAVSAEEARIQQLQQQIQELEKQAAQYRQGIASERAKADTLAKEIAILRGQIGQVEAQIAATDKKIDLTETEIHQVEEHITEKQTEVQQKQDTIGRMILFMQQQEQQSTLETLVKYANLSMFFRQLDDVATVQDRLLENIAQLRQARMVLEQEHDSLEQKQEELETLNAQAEQKRAQLAGVKGQRDKTLQVTKGVEANYQKQLSNVEKQKAAFFKELRELELKVVSGGLYIVHITADSVPPPGTKLFAWPEDNYHLTQGYGMTTYAKRGAYGGSPHNGIDMSAGYGSEIKAIGDGQIVANGSNSGWGNWVAIKHLNNMVSIYGHMSSLSFLKVGSQVTQGQTIGYEGNTGNATGSHLHLSLYREFFTYLKAGTNELYFNYFDGSLNPANYL
jgi:murein DD-endopeptidase MepM/ murein hydrolase activator NlpD